MTKKREPKIQHDKFNDHGFSLTAKAEVDLDFLNVHNWRPVTIRIELDKEEQLDLLRAIVKRNGLRSKETCVVDESVTLSLVHQGINFTLHRS